ncbi:MAG TPA: TetR/AcrR family transcriptional regulator [Hyphomicrobiaceae bacterium]|jgi:AcrR family transcriptional regulator|nr:TetR/AcrR family transcriptional regulator [Hyphomicrobiaceae bacterium]
MADAAAVPRTNATRERILELAEAAVLDKGFAATSIEELIAGAGITKSGFFYHFRDKGELARALMLRYIAHNDAVLDDIFVRADELNEDPLHGFLVALKLFAEMMAELPATHPGCLVASFCYQDRLFDGEVRTLTQTGVRSWRKLFLDRLEIIAGRYPPKVALSLEDLADMANTLVDGGIIMSRVLVDKTILPRQILLYREFIRTVFLGPASERTPGSGAQS